jgi:uncharacterized protein
VKAINVKFGPAELVLLPAKAIFWPEQNLLLVADLHLGKDDHFRASGIQVPSGRDDRTFQVLENLLEAYPTSDLCALGDTFHGRFSLSAGLRCSLESFLGRFGKRCRFIAGNHDRHVLGQSTPVKFEGPQEVGGFRLDHQPFKRDDLPTLCGHVHPGVLLTSGRGRAASAPAFVAIGSNLILPALGSLTGFKRYPMSEVDWAVAVCEDSLVPIRGHSSVPMLSS